jgi:hypothetical protein
MANQAIALQARAPQGNFLAPAIQQGAQFINMMSQQRAAERQAAVQQQQMEIQRAAEAREAAKAGRDKQTFELDLPGKIYEKHRALGSVAAEGGAPVYAQWLEAYGQDDPKVAAIIAKAMPVDQFDPDRFTRMLATMDQRFEARYGKAIIKEFIGEDGTLLSGNFSGLPGASYVTRTPDITSTLKAPQPAAAAPSATGVQPMAAPQTPAPAAGGTFQPISATGGQQQGNDPATVALAKSLTDAQETKQIDAGTVEQIKTRIQPELVDRFIQVNNIKVAPGGMRSAVYRPDGGAPMAQQVQYNPNDFPTARVKSPMQAPMPGSAIVPLTRVREEAAAGRATPAEAAAVASATATATKAAELKAEQAKKLPAKRQVSTLLQKIRNAYETLNTAEAIPSSERGAFANVFDYLSTTGMGREVQRALGTSANKSLNEIVNSRKLLATAIKNATGMGQKEMDSNVELQLTLDALTDPTQGYESVISQIDTLEQLYGAGGGGTVEAAPLQTPTTPATPPIAAIQMLRKNPTPAERKMFDSVFGVGAAAKALGGR